LKRSLNLLENEVYNKKNNAGERSMKSLINNVEAIPEHHYSIPGPSHLGDHKRRQLLSLQKPNSINIKFKERY
jgi:hypothetical protein